MIRLPEELDFHSVTYADGTDATWRHAWYATCMHAWCIACRSIQLSPVSGSQIVEIVGKTWRSVEDAKVKGTQKVGGAGKRKKEGPFLSLVSSRFFFVCFLFSFLFSFLFCFFHGRTFSIQRTLLSRSLEHTKAEEGLPTSDFRSRGVATLTHGTWKRRAQKRYKMNN